MFPNLDKDIIDDVVRMKEGRYVATLSKYHCVETCCLTYYRVGLAVDACLALSSTE
jgi:hypothetical protein